MDTQTNPATGTAANMQSQNQGASRPGSQSAGGIKDEVASGAHELADKARNLAGDAQDKAADKIRSTVDTGRARAADTLADVARTLKSSGEQDESMISGYMNQAGDQVQRVADYVKRSDVRGLMRDTERFARQQPALFLGGAFAIGVIAARFLKSSPNTGSRYGNQDMAGFHRDEEGYHPALGDRSNARYSADATSDRMGGRRGVAGMQRDDERAIPNYRDGADAPTSATGSER